MSHDALLEIPKSFTVLYSDVAPQSRYAPRDLVAIRYKVCEEMTEMLMEIAQYMLTSLGFPKEDVLARCQRGLNKRGSAVTEYESGWVISRLAELLNREPLSAQ